MTLYYALWVTRNGQRMWSGPHYTKTKALSELDQLMYCTGKRVTEEEIK